MLIDIFSLKQTLVSAESALRIDYTEKDTAKIVQQAVQKLENAYQCHLDDPVYVVQAKNELVADHLNEFIQQVGRCVMELSGIVLMSMYTKKPPVDLRDVNYLGFAQKELATALKYLQDKVHYEQRQSIIPALYYALNNVEMSQIKRLFIVMLLCERLGLPEAVSVCAALLYQGVLVL